MKRDRFTFRRIYRWSDYGEEISGQLPDIAVLNGEQVDCSMITYNDLRLTRGGRIVKLNKHISMMVSDWGDDLGNRSGACGCTVTVIAPTGTQFLHIIRCNVCGIEIERKEPTYRPQKETLCEKCAQERAEREILIEKCVWEYQRWAAAQEKEQKEICGLA